MKKSMAILLALLLCISVLGCNQATRDHADKNSKPEDLVHNGSSGLKDEANTTLSGSDSSTNDVTDSGSQQAGSNAGNNDVSAGEENSGSETKPDSCTYCNQEGHNADTCPVKAADEAPCEYCKEKGHKIDNCAQKVKDETICNNCKEKGHEIKNCPNKVCTYCKLTGHLEDECSSKQFDERFCDYCGARGHLRETCPQKKEHNSFCTYCNMKGHSIEKCFDRIQAEDICRYCGLSGNDHDKSVCAATPCSYCGELGHWVEECILKINDDRNYCAYCKVYGHKRSTCEKEAADFAAFDINYWVQYAKDYAISVGLKLDPTMSKEKSSWDAPIPATYRSKYIADDVQSRMNTYVKYIEEYGIAGIVWVEALPDGPYEWDLFVYYG